MRLANDLARKAAIVGIGVNVNAARADFSGDLRATATSLAIEKGSSLPRASVAQAILRRFEHWYRPFNADRADEVVARWSELSTTLGKTVTVRAGGEPIRGAAVRMDADGALVVQSGDTRTRVTIGDVSDS